MRKAVILAVVAGALAAFAVLAWPESSSPGYIHGPAAVTKAGGFVTGNLEASLLTVGDSVTGEAASASYKTGTGFVHALAFEEQEIWATDVASPDVIGSSGTADLPWASSGAGTWELKSGAATLDSGSVNADDTVTSQVLGADLTENTWNEISVHADLGGDPQGLTWRVFFDGMPPTLSNMEMTEIAGAVDLGKAAAGTNSVTLKVAGEADQQLPLGGGGSFTAALPAGTTVATIEVESLFHRTTRRVVTLLGDPPEEPAIDVAGRTIWISDDGQVELIINVTNQDEKGKLYGDATVRFAGDPNVYDLGPLKGKIKTKPSDKGQKVSFKLKSLKKAYPKIGVSMKGVWRDGLVTGAVTKVKVKHDKKNPPPGAQDVKATFYNGFMALEDNGNPIAIQEVKVTGTATDGRAGGQVTVKTTEGTFVGETAVGFAETLPDDMDYSSSITADDDTSPPNQRAETIWASVSWAEGP